MPWASRAASSASTSSPSGWAIVPLTSATATTVSPARVRKRAVAPPMVPSPWSATRVPGYGTPARSRAVSTDSATPQPPTSSSSPMPSTSTAKASASRARAAASSSSSGWTACTEETSPTSATARSTRSWLSPRSSPVVQQLSTYGRTARRKRTSRPYARGSRGSQSMPPLAPPSGTYRASGS